MSDAVSWGPSAERDLVDLWNTALDRAELTRAADAVDAALARDPLALGESRGGRTRIAFERPLVVLFDVDPSRQAVTVWAVWRWPRGDIGGS